MIDNSWMINTDKSLRNVTVECDVIFGNCIEVAGGVELTIEDSSISSLNQRRCINLNATARLHLVRVDSKTFSL